MSQVKNYCKAGREIDNARITKYEGFYRKIIRDFLPGLCLNEASMSYDDLLNQLRYEAFMAIKNGFDPEKAMDSTIKDPEKRAKQIEKKKANPEKALEQAEKNMVYGRLVNYMRRTRWKYHPDQRGGRTLQFGVFAHMKKNDAKRLANEDDGDMEFLSSDYHYINHSQVESDRFALIKAMNDGKNVRDMFFELPEDRRDELLEFLSSRSLRVEGGSFEVDESRVEVVSDQLDEVLA